MYIVEDIGKDDAYYLKKDEFIGKRISGIKRLDRWMDNGAYFGKVSFYCDIEPYTGKGARTFTFHELYLKEV